MTKTTRNVIIVIIVTFIVRLFGITNPPLERSHNWRQSFTAMVARNFDHADFVNPEVDIDGGAVIAMEFPVYSYCIHIINYIFGFNHWYGRLINLLVASIGLFYFYKLVSLMYSENHALYSTVILAFSILFSFSRKIMPDAFSLSLTIGGVYFVSNYICDKKHSIVALFVGSVLVILGLLSKIPSFTVLAFLIPIMADNKFKSSYKVKAILMGILPGFSAAFLWYGIIVPAQLKSGAMQLYFPMDVISGLSLIIEHASGVLEKFYFSAFCSYILFLFFLAGILFKFVNWERSLILLFLASAISFFFFMLKASNFFYFHNYYIIPFVPFMSVLAGYGIEMLAVKRKRLVIVLLSIGVAEAIMNQQHDFYIPKAEKYKLSLTEIVQKFVSPDQKVVLNTGPNPQQLYFCDRKGWLLDSPDCITRKLIESKTSENVIIIIDRHIKTAYEKENFSIHFENSDYLLLKKTEQ